MAFKSFEQRHIGPRESEIKEMTKTIGVASLDQLISETVPANIRLKKELDLSLAMSEFEYANHIQAMGAKNKVYKSYIGQGYHPCIVPAVIQRNVLENPGWYTAYTPYQAEIAQGRLEALLNFQTLVIELTGQEIANASLLDESTACAEAMSMFYDLRSRDAQKRDVKKFFISQDCFPQNIDLMKTRATPLGIELIVGDQKTVELDNSFFGALLQYPDTNGEIHNIEPIIQKAHASDVKVCVATDLLALTLIKSPGEMGADCVVGTSQRFGIPMGYGGPHAAFFTTREDYKRSVPGRIIGVSRDTDGNPAFRMALQTREQHIKRDKATSNICTAQALLAVMSSFYAAYHGPDGLKKIAEKIHQLTSDLSLSLKSIGLKQVNTHFFDTITFEADASILNKIKTASERAEMNFYYRENSFSISINETNSEADIQSIVKVIAASLDKNALYTESKTDNIPIELKRSSTYLTHPVFNTYHSETEMMRYIKKLENRDLSLTHSMISLGSCTMKLNAASELYPITNPNFANIHPFVPANQVEGYLEMIDVLGKDLAEITGFDAMSFQPNSGAQGEYAGLMVIRAYHEANGDHHRNICLIPSSAHGTNPASAVMAGMKVVVIKCDELGNIDIDNLRQNAEEHKENLSALMVTYPSTHGVFEEGIIEITNIIHENGGQVYMDGANMNAQVGLTSPGNIGADVCHLNLHKTFAIPHGGGGPGMGPIGVRKHLTPFLPSHPIIKTGGDKGITAISAAPFGSALILLISYGYIKMLGKQGVTNSTKMAILNANYMKSKLKGHFEVLYQGKNERIAHEMILDCRDFKRTAGIEVEDIAKRLMDYGFHAPTVSFPVAGTLMVEPTESEPKGELDRFVEAMISIRNEIKEIELGIAGQEGNVLKNAPHTANLVISDNWNMPYSREKAAFPLSWVREAKFWPHVRRVDSAFGDRNLVCSCLPMEDYLEV
jgi:glycine dehydrogenase